MTTSKPPRVPYFERGENSPPMGLTPRDKQILETLYAFEGVLSDNQIARLFFKGERRMKARMSLLYRNGYVTRFDRRERNSFPYMAYFLDEQGVEYLASVRGILPQQLKARAKNERKSLIPHDIELNEVRIAVLEALSVLPNTQLLEWINSRTFWRDHDQITYTDGQGKHKRRYIRPDAHIHVISPGIEKPRHSRLLLELDRSTEHNRRFVEEKIRPGLAYINSQEYKERFGVNRGRWLVVTTGETRLAHMLKAAGTAGEAARAFYFTTFAEATTPGAFFTKPIWRRPLTGGAAALLSNNTKEAEETA